MRRVIQVLAFGRSEMVDSLFRALIPVPRQIFLCPTLEDAKSSARPSCGRPASGSRKLS